jgi:hypothetical protein
VGPLKPAFIGLSAQPDTEVSILGSIIAGPVFLFFERKIFRVFVAVWRMLDVWKCGTDKKKILVRIKMNG